MKLDSKQRRKEYLQLKAEEEACISEEARMGSEEEEHARLMAEEKTCISGVMMLKADKEE